MGTKEDVRINRILSRVKHIPKGSVATYGDIDPRAPRMVGCVLSMVDDGAPWHRVVRTDGSLPLGDRQRDLLLKERVPMKGDRVDLRAARAGTDNSPRLVRAIVFQQLAGAAARAIHGRVRAAVDGDLTPKAVADVPDATLRAAGLSAAKLASLRDLSSKVLDGTVLLDETSKLTDEEIIARLTTVRGIGRWTAEMYLMFELRRLDVWPVDDLGVRQGYGLAWGLRATPTAKDLASLGERFRPYRSIVARYCWEAVALFRRGTDPRLRQ